MVGTSCTYIGKTKKGVFSFPKSCQEFVIVQKCAQTAGLI